MAAPFDTATAVRRDGRGCWTAEMDDGWWVLRGPNGGYVAAVVLRALADAVDQPERAPRSLTLHYLRPPAVGPVTVEARVERSGRSLTTASGRLTQDGALLVTALAAFSVPWSTEHDFSDARPPAAEPPTADSGFERPDAAPPIAHRWDFAGPLGGPPFGGASEALSGGWLRLAEPRVADAFVVAAMTDAWFPAVFARLTAPAALPTIDLTIHFREELPLDGARPEDWYLARFASRAARQGFVEEDGEIWSADGRLLAQSRQLALMI